MADLPQVPITKIDNVNWLERWIDTGSGKVKLVGMSARALKKALEGVDNDDLVCYMAEMTPEVRDQEVLLGCIGGVGVGTKGVTMLVGSEVSNMLKRASTEKEKQ